MQLLPGQPPQLVGPPRAGSDDSATNTGARLQQVPDEFGEMLVKAAWKLYRRILAILPSSSQRFLIGYSISLSVLSTLDGAALGLLAVVINPIVSGNNLVLPV